MKYFGDIRTVVPVVPYKRCAVFIGILGCIQSIIWAVLALFLICTHFFLKSAKSSNIYWKSFHKNYISIHADGALRMLIFSCVYLCLSLFWLLVSINLLLKVHYSRQPDCPYVSWSAVTLTVCLADLVFFGLTVTDVVTLSNERDDPLPQDERTTSVCDECLYGVQLAVMLALMSIMARGFILWVLNVVLSVLLIMAQHVPKKRTKKRRRVVCDICNVEPKTVCDRFMSRPPPRPPVCTLGMLQNMYGPSHPEAPPKRPCDPPPPKRPCEPTCTPVPICEQFLARPPAPPPFTLGMMQNMNVPQRPEVPPPPEVPPDPPAPKGRCAPTCARSCMNCINWAISRLTPVVNRSFRDAIDRFSNIVNPWGTRGRIERKRKKGRKRRKHHKEIMAKKKAKPAKAKAKAKGAKGGSGKKFQCRCKGINISYWMSSAGINGIFFSLWLFGGSIAFITFYKMTPKRYKNVDASFGRVFYDSYLKRGKDGPKRVYNTWVTLLVFSIIWFGLSVYIKRIAKLAKLGGWNNMLHTKIVIAVWVLTTFIIHMIELDFALAIYDERIPLQKPIPNPIRHRPESANGGWGEGIVGSIMNKIVPDFSTWIPERYLSWKKWLPAIIQPWISFIPIIGRGRRHAQLPSDMDPRQLQPADDKMHTQPYSDIHKEYPRQSLGAALDSLNYLKAPLPEQRAVMRAPKYPNIPPPPQPLQVSQRGGWQPGPKYMQRMDGKRKKKGRGGWLFGLGTLFDKVWGIFFPVSMWPKNKFMEIVHDVVGIVPEKIREWFSFLDPYIPGWQRKRTKARQPTQKTKDAVQLVMFIICFRGIAFWVWTFILLFVVAIGLIPEEVFGGARVTKGQKAAGKGKGKEKKAKAKVKEVRTVTTEGGRPERRYVERDVDEEDYGGTIPPEPPDLTLIKLKQLCDRWAAMGGYPPGGPPAPPAEPPAPAP